jgi:hypothetical protein
MGRIGTRTARGWLLGAGTAAIAVGATTATAAAGGRPPTLSARSHAAGLAAVTYGQSIRLSGDERRTGSRTVELQADPFPFAAGFRTVAQERTHGKYAFTVTPEHATQYRAVVTGVSGATSRVVTVYVLARTVSSHCNLCILSNSPGAHVLVIKAQVRPDAGVGPFYFYYGQIDGSTAAPKNLPLVKVVSPEITPRDVAFTVSYVVHFPSGASRFRYTYCRRDNEAQDGWGLPGRHHCGDATVNTSEYLG